MDFKRTHHVDITEHVHSPAEESLHETYILRKNSTVESLYSSNVYEGQCFGKTIKQLDKGKKIQMAAIDREMKIMEKRMNDLKARRKSDRFLKVRSETISCEKDLNWNTKASLGLPSLPLGDGPQRMGSRPLSRTMSDISWHNVTDQRRFPEPSTPTINIMACKNDTDSGTKTEDDTRNKSEENISNISNNNKNPTFHPKMNGASCFTIDSRGKQDSSPRLSRKSKKPSVDTPPRRSPSPCNFTSVEKTQANFAQPSSPRLRRALASKSNDDISTHSDSTSISDVDIVRLERRPRSHTFSGHIMVGPRDENFSGRDGTNDDGSHTLVLPKI